MERNAAAEKAGPENEAADTKNRFPIFERREPTNFRDDLLGMEGVEHWEWAGVRAALASIWGKPNRVRAALAIMRRIGGVGTNDACDLAR